jgi:hypothetical protein
VPQTVVARISRTLTACGFLFAACAPQSAREPALEAASSTRSVHRETPLGLCEDYPPESTTLERLNRDFTLLTSIGSDVLRVSFGWDDLEPTPGKYVFDGTDRFVDLAVGKYGLTLIPYVTYTPAWAASIQGEDGWKSPPRDAETFGALMAELARRYAGKIDTWEVWNEPDNSDFFTGDVADFAELLEAGARGVRRGNPQAKVVLGGIADNLGFLKSLLSEHGSAPQIDIVNLHRYPETWTGDSIESITTFITQAREIVETFGEGEPLWLAEVGYSSFRRGTAVSNWFEAKYDYEHTPEFQAVALGRIVTLALSTEQLGLIAWYEISDLPTFGEVIGDVNNRHLGVLSVDGTPKPALHAFRTVKRLYDQPLRVLRVALRSEGVDAQALSVHAFERADRSVILAAWLKTITPARAGTAPGEDPRRGIVSVTLPVGMPEAARAKLFDAEGEALPSQLRLESKRGSTTLEGLELAGGEIVFVELAAR